MILDLIMLLLQTDSEILLRIFEFLWHSLPELVLTYTFIAISWNQTTFRFAVRSLAVVFHSGASWREKTMKLR
jgi:hypothetical protein